MWNWIKKCSELEKLGQDFALLTTTQTGGSTPREVGSKMIVLPDGSFYGTIGGGNLENQIIKTAQKCILESMSSSFSFNLGAKTGQCCGGVVEIFIDVVQCQPKVFIFGAGHVGQNLANTLVGTPYKVHLIDTRDEWIQHENLSPDIIKISENPLQFVMNKDWLPRSSLVLIMTHSHQLDFDLLSSLVDKNLLYLGLIGSQTKWLRFKKRLEEKEFEKDDIYKVKCPIGIPIGGKAPKEIAISVSAELLGILYN